MKDSALAPLTSEKPVTELAFEERLVIQKTFRSLCFCYTTLAKPWSPSSFLHEQSTLILMNMPVGQSRLVRRSQRRRESALYGRWRKVVLVGGAVVLFGCQ